MNKRSKVLMIGAAVGAVSLFTVTALASTPNTAGYDAFKAVLKANHAAEMPESATLNGRFAVSMDGEAVLAANGTAKMRGADDAHAVSADFDFTLMGVERSGSVYSGGDDTMYFVDRTHDLHYQIVGADHDDKREWEHEWDAEDRAMSKAEEALLDYMVGDLKNEFSVTNGANGSKTITVDVSKDEIPLPLRLLLDVASNGDRHERGDWDAEDANAHELLQRFPFFQGLEEGLKFEEQLPELTDDVAIERVRLELTVDADNELQRVDGKLEVTGKDEKGDFHRVSIEGAGDVSGLNATTPDVYDPTGHTVEIVDAASFDDRD
jgi:hypothetical protein